MMLVANFVGRGFQTRPRQCHPELVEGCGFQDFSRVLNSMVYSTLYDRVRI